MSLPPTHPLPPDMAQIVLLTSPHAQWPADVSGSPLTQINLADLDSPSLAAAGDTELWIGYCDPLQALQRALVCPSGEDPEGVLQRWENFAERVLLERHRQPQRCHLVNLSSLSAAAGDQLRARLGLEAGRLPAAPASLASQSCGRAELEQPSPAALSELVISQRQRLLELHADLEAQAELFGREPQFQLPIPACRDPALGARLLQAWQEQSRSLRAAQAASTSLAQRLEQLRLEQEQLLLKQEKQRLEQEQQRTKQDELRGERDQLRADNQTLRSDKQQLCDERDQALRQAGDERLRHEQHKTLQSSLEARLIEAEERCRSIAAEAEARRLELEDDQELLMLQLKQLQEELSGTFEALQSCRDQRRQQDERLLELEQRCGELSGELELLGQECRHLFQHSQMQQGIDRARIGRILTLVKQSLHS